MNRRIALVKYLQSGCNERGAGTALLGGMDFPGVSEQGCQLNALCISSVPYSTGKRISSIRVDMENPGLISQVRRTKEDRV